METGRKFLLYKGAKMLKQALNCPNCGAPVQVESDQTIAICVYCNSSIKIDHPGTTNAQASIEGAVSSETVRQIKQLLLSGHYRQAIKLYQEKAGADLQEAEKAVGVFGKQVSYGIARDQMLNVFGRALVLSFIIALVGGGAAGLAKVINPQLSLIIMGIPGLLLLLFAGSIRKTIKFTRAKLAPATVLRIAPIGEMPGVHTFRVLLEVRPERGESFQAEITLPVRESSLPKLHEGTAIQVRYLSEDGDDVIFDKLLSH